MSRFYIFLIYACIQPISGFGQDGFIKGAPALAYWETGSGKEIVIVLHGGPAAAHDYLRPEWDELGKESRVFYYDQRGCGKSDSAYCYSWREHVSDLKRLINQIAKGKKVVLAGSSWGSILALLYTYSYPKDVKGVILSGTVPWHGLGFPEQDCTNYIPHDGTVRGKLQHEFIITGNKKFIELRSFEFSYTLNSLNDGPSLKQLQEINIPVLVFGGSGSSCEPGREASSQFAGILPRLEIFTIAESCHDPWYTHPQVFFEKCKEFIRTKI